MPRIPVRTEPYSSPSRQHRHFKNKRDQVLRALGKAAYINGSHFAIMWVSARGDVETYASEMLQGRLDEWFVQGGIAEQAKQLVRSGSGEKQEGGGGVWEDSDDGEADADGDEEEKEEEDLFAEEGEKENVAAENEEVKGKGKRAPPAPLNTTIANQHFLRSRNPLSSTINHHSDDPFAAAPRSAPLFSSSTPLTPNEAPLTSTPLLPSSTRLSSSRTSLSSTSSTPLLTPPLVEITLSTPSARTAFLELRFGQLQQGVCKTVAKAWIKIIEPKKQTRCPYNKGESGKPDWWPAGVRHKEPDHLMKPERHSLLLTILRSPKVKVARLQLATAEVVALIKADKVSLLMDVYRVAREEERLRERGEEEGEVRVQVSTLDGWCSEGSEPTRAGRKVARSVTPEVAGEKGRKRSAAVAMIKSHSTSGTMGARKRRSIAASSLSAEVRPRPLPSATANDVFGTMHAQHQQPLIGLGLGAMPQFGAGAGMLRSHSFSAVPSSSSGHLNTTHPSSSETSPWPPASLNFTADVNGLTTPLTASSTLDPSYPAYHHAAPDPNAFYYPAPPAPHDHPSYPPHPHAIPHHHFTDAAMPPFDNALGLENWSFANFLPDLSNGSWHSQQGAEASFSFDTLNSGGGPRTPSPAPAEGELRLGLAKGGQIHPSLNGGGQEAFWLGSEGEVGQFGGGQGGGS